MILVVGLGNIGKLYQNTRHNIGFIAVDFLAEHYKLSWNIKTKFQVELASGSINEHKILLVKPLTYMNLSGQAVQLISTYYNINPQSIFVVHDDVDLEIGRIKYKLGGSNGGHNGLKSIDQYIGNKYHRIRIGIGRPLDNQSLAEYVLDSFSQNENKIITNFIKIITNNLPFLWSKEWEKFKKGVADDLRK